MKKFQVIILSLCLSLIWITGCAKPTNSLPASPTAPTPTLQSLQDKELLGGILVLFTNPKNPLTAQQKIALKHVVDEYFQNTKALHNVELTAPAFFTKDQLAYINKLKTRGELNQGLKIKNSLTGDTLALAQTKVKKGGNLEMTSSGNTAERLAWHDVLHGILQCEKKPLLAITSKQASGLLPQIITIQNALLVIADYPLALKRILTPAQLSLINRSRKKCLNLCNRTGETPFVLHKIGELSQSPEVQPK